PGVCLVDVEVLLVDVEAGEGERDRLVVPDREAGEEGLARPDHVEPGGPEEDHVAQARRAERGVGAGGEGRAGSPGARGRRRAARTISSSCTTGERRSRARRVLARTGPASETCRPSLR